MSEKEYLLQLLNLQYKVHRNNSMCCPHCGSIGNWGDIIIDNEDITISNHTCFLCGYNFKKFNSLIKWIREI